MNVILQKNARFYLDNLVEILVEKNYFSSRTSAKDYVQNIYDFIEFQLPDFPSRITNSHSELAGYF